MNPKLEYVLLPILIWEVREKVKNIKSDYMEILIIKKHSKCGKYSWRTNYQARKIN